MTRTQLIQLLTDTHASKETLCHVMHVWPDESEKKIYPLSEVLQKCAEVVGSTVEDLESKNRSRQHVRGRMLFVFYVHKYQYGKYSLKSIAELIGKRDHTTVINLRERSYDLEYAKDDIFVDDVRNLNILLGGGKISRPVPVVEPKKRENNQRKRVMNVVTHQVYDTMIEAAKDNRVSKDLFYLRIKQGPTKHFPFKLVS